jgi:hypothetical protein
MSIAEKCINDIVIAQSPTQFGVSLCKWLGELG